MKVFISFSGAASHAVAEVLKRYLRFMLQDVQPFLSSHDIGSGTRWITELSRELDESNFGIICLTPDNLHADWVLFEAGALAKHHESHACCLLFQGLKPANITDPLSQFHNRVFNKEDVLKLVSDINQTLPVPLQATDLQLIFEKWWPELEENVKLALQNAGDAVAPPKLDAAAILDEVLKRIRSLELNIYQSISMANQAGRSSQRLVDQATSSFYYSLSPEQWRVVDDLVSPNGDRLMRNISELELTHDRKTIYSLMQTGFVVWCGRDGEVAVFSEDIAKKAPMYKTDVEKIQRL